MQDFDPSKNPGNYKWGIFYFNSDDNRIFVPKRINWTGWTLNFAKPESYFLLLLVFAVTFLINIYKSGQAFF